VVWALVFYQYPTKTIIETAIRFEGQREVSFEFGWENVRLIPVFVTGFMVRLFYLGADSVSVDVVVTSLANLVTLTGLGFLVILVVPILKPDGSTVHCSARLSYVPLERFQLKLP
jgi:hypothetical protein